MVYMSDKKALKIFEACMNELYLASIPSISWAEVREKYGDDERSEFYMKHVIKSVDYDMIVSRYNKLLTSYYRRQFAWYLLDYAPTCED